MAVAMVDAADAAGGGPATGLEAERVVDAVEARVAELSGLLNATHAALVDSISEMLASECWGGGYRSPEHWVALHCGVSRARAAQLVAAARRMNELPQVARRFRAGEMSVDQATAVLTRTPVDHDQRMAELAPMLSMGQLRQVLAALPPLPAPPSDNDPKPEPEPEEPRRLSGHFADHSTYLLRGKVPGDCGALWEKAMAAARTDLFDRHVAGIDSVAALEHILNLALDALDPAAARGERAGDRYQVMLHMDRRRNGPLDQIQPHLGPWLPSGLSRYLCCDSTVRLALYDTDDHGTSRLVGFSPQARVVDAKTRAAIEHRDRGCRVPGCDQRGWLHIHHIRHWADGGLTMPSNLVALCPHHHRLHHLGLLVIDGDPERPDGLIVTDTKGHPVGASPPRPPHLGLVDTAEDLHLPPGTTWAHPWGEPLDRNSIAWN